MIPLVVTAHLATPCLPNGPVLFDGVLLAGHGARLGRNAPGGWASMDEVMADPLPLATVHHGEAWWYAASQAIPEGPESMRHGHRRPALESLARWTSAPSVHHSAGPDKSLRVPLYARTGWRVVHWTCIGDPDRIAVLLALTPGIGARLTHGYGWVTRWEMTRGGPGLDAYFSARVRPVPREAALDIEGAWQNRMPLTPPYYERHRAVPVYQHREDR